jgi:signal transduction histidine kinase
MTLRTRSIDTGCAPMTTPKSRGPALGQFLQADARALAALLRSAGSVIKSLVLLPDPPAHPVARRALQRVSAHTTVLSWGGAAALFVAGIPATAGNYRLPAVLLPLLSALYALPFVMVVPAPLRAWRLVVLAGLIGPVVTQPFEPHGIAWPITQMIVALVTCYAVALRHHRHVVMAVWAVSAVTIAWGLVFTGPGAFAERQFVVAAGAVGLVLLAGHVWGTRGLMLRRLAEGERLREESESHRAVLQERARIARELHDVVAHHMSMIAVQAETAPYRFPGLGARGGECLADIATTARGGLVEMRRLLGVLHDGRDGADGAPQPDLGELDGLVAGARRAGLTVESVITGQVRALPPGTELSAFRIVQEGLSNAARHAPGTAVVVGLDYGPHHLRVEVSNSAPQQPMPVPPPGGHGLVGIRERAAMHGGSAEAGPTAQGGYRVRALLPVDDRSAR